MERFTVCESILSTAHVKFKIYKFYFYLYLYHDSFQSCDPSHAPTSRVVR